MFRLSLSLTTLGAIQLLRSGTFEIPRLETGVPQGPGQGQTGKPQQYPGRKPGHIPQNLKPAPEHDTARSKCRKRPNGCNIISLLTGSSKVIAI